MKISFVTKFIMCLGALLLICVAASMASVVDANLFSFNTLKETHSLAFSTAIIVSGIGNITPEMINDAKLKFGKGVRILTVVAVGPTYDFDQLTIEQKIALSKLKIDLNIICNKDLPYETRLVELSKLQSIDEKTRPDVTGRIIVESEEYHFLVRRPDKAIIQLLTSCEKKEMDKFFEIAKNNLIVGGDIDSLDDGVVYLGFIGEVREMISPAQSFLLNA